MKKILIADDSTSIRLVLEEIFKENYIVKSADDGHMAIVLLSQGFSPDLIITDIKMPSINGKELIHFLQQSPLYSHIPIIIISSFTEEELSADEEITNVNFVLNKPFNLAELLTSVSSILDTSDERLRVPI